MLSILNKNKKRKVDDNSLDCELIDSLDNFIHSRNDKQYDVIFSANFDVNAVSLYSTLTQLVYLLTRKRLNNSLHMHMIMCLSEEINKFIVQYHSSKNPEELNLKHMFRSAELLLENCYRIMDLAERKTADYEKVEEKYIFKDGVPSGKCGFTTLSLFS